MAYINHNVPTMSMPSGMNRMDQFPLDMSSVYYSYEAMENYAKSSAISYVGQILSLVVYAEDGETVVGVKVYSIQDTAGTLKEVGTKPVGDESTVVVAENGTISLAGIEDLVFEREVDVLGKDGQPTGEKKTETVQYQALLTKDGLTWVEPSKTTVEGLATLIDALAARVTTAEGDIDALETAVGGIKTEIGVASAEGVEATGIHKLIEDEASRATTAEGLLDGRITALEGKEDKDTTYSVKEGEKVLSLDGTAFGTTLKIDYSDNKIKLLGINDALISEFDASAFTVDGVLEDASYDADKKELVFTWNIKTDETEDGQPIYKTDIVPVGDLVDTYTSGNGITVDNNVISAKVVADDKYLTVDETGIHTKGIDDAIATAKGEAQAAAEATAAADATAKANAAQAAAEATAAADATAKANAVRTYVGEFTTGEDDYKDLTSVVAYINKKAEETLSAAQGGSSETAASVALALQNYKNENDPKVKANTDKLATIAEGAQVNVIEAVVAKEGAKITATKDGKTVTIDDAALIGLINAADAKAGEGKEAAAAAQNTANEANTQASANKTAIEGLVNTTIPGVKAIADKNKEDIAALQTTVSGHTGSISGLEAAVATKAEAQTVTDLATRVGTNEGAIAQNKADVAALTEVVNGKANTSAVYTKSEVDGLVSGEAKARTQAINGINAKIGTIAEGKDVATLIGENATAISDVNKALEAEVKRATDAEKANGEEIARIDAALKLAVEDTTEGSGINSIKELATWVNEHGKDASAMTEAINKNKDDLAALAKTHADFEAAVPGMISAALPVIATTEVAGIVKASASTVHNGVQVAEDGTMSVASVKVSTLFQDATLVLNGGNASGEVTE